jgi:hypothetical protein
MRRASVFAALILSVFAVQSASAAVIGVRGGDAGSPPMTNPSFFPLLQDDCTTALYSETDPLAGYYCVTYSTGFVDGDGLVYALDLQFKDPDGNLVLVSTFTDIAEESHFQLRFDLDQFTIRLCADSLLGQAACDPYFEYPEITLFNESGINQTHFRVFTDLEDHSVSIRAINTISNVPEPGMLLLLGLGVTAVAGRRLRIRRH